MPKHNNLSIYQFNSNINPNDGLLGFSENDYRRTKNHKFSDIVNFIATQIAITEDGVVMYLLSNQVLTGGYISWNGGLSHYVAPLTYIIQNLAYQSDGGDFIFEDAHETYGRFDAIVADTNGDVSIIQGQPSEIPSQPVIDGESFVLVSYVYIPANSTTIEGVSKLIVYAEALNDPDEFAVSEDALADFAFDIDQDTIFNGGNVAIWYKRNFLKNKLLFRTYDFLYISDYTTLEFYINISAISVEDFIYIGFFNSDGSSYTEEQVLLRDGTFNYDASLINRFQRIIIPLTYFSNFIPEDFDHIFIMTAESENQVDFFVDDISLISGIPTNNAGNTFLNLDDVEDTSYTGKEGYVPTVVNGQLLLKKPYWTRINGFNADVHKIDGNDDFTTIENGDIVSNAVFTEGFLTYFLPYGTYNESLGLNTDRASYDRPILMS